MNAILGLGVVDLAIGIAVMGPLSIMNRKNELMSATFSTLFQICTTVGMGLVTLVGLMVLAM